MQEISKNVWHAYFPEEINVPDCVRKLLEFLYPTINWDNVSFYDGIPYYMNGGQIAMTMPDAYSFTKIDIYFGSGKWNPCTKDGLATIVHEGFHVLQMHDVLGGAGIGMVRPFLMQYLSCYAGDGFDYNSHPMELAAYHMEGLFYGCYDGSNPICDCGAGNPVLNQANLDSFKKHCAGIVQTSSGIDFWKGMAASVPGLSSISGAAQWLFNKACKSNGIKGAAATVRAKQSGISIPVQWIACALGTIVAGILYAVYAIYFIVWFAINLIVTIAAEIVRIIWDLIGVIADGVLWIVTGIVCAAEWIWGKIVAAWNWFKGILAGVCDWASSLQITCAEWETTQTQQCTQTEDQGYNQCTQQEDEGYNQCSKTEDQGYKDCCGWWPCSWACDAWTWISNIVCVAWTWVSNIVCIAWTWVSNIVCVAWTWVVSKTCKAFTWVVKGLTCWAH